MSKAIKIEIKDWISQRMNGIGGSDAASALGLSPWKSPYQLYMEKSGQMPANVEENEAMHFGKRLESVIADEFQERSGLEVRRCNYILQSSEYPWMIANIDREGRDADGKRFVLECKNVGEWSGRGWADSDIPVHHLVQVIHYIIVGGYDYGILAGLIGGNRYEQRVIIPDPELVAMVIDGERRFWQHVTDRIEPPLVSSDNDYMAEVFPFGNASITRQDRPGLIDLIKTRQSLSEQIKSLEDSRDYIDAQIKKDLGECEQAQAGEWLVNWKTIESNRADTSRLKSEFPDVYSQIVSKSTYRRFEIKPVKKSK